MIVSFALVAIIPSISTKVSFTPSIAIVVPVATSVISIAVDLEL